ncbi:protein disulfide isomerase [Anaeramoeba flamelloides]|uniref:Protein disulfide isomerase n=1 Tax=Anaeramoeba flamelloides TaxID=1746091 RepID=A0AAV7YRR6_9EUKA|nr:protein disulfide isomerase [Anaeramoeba flamelloides]
MKLSLIFIFCLVLVQIYCASKTRVTEVNSEELVKLEMQKKPFILALVDNKTESYKKFEKNFLKMELFFRTRKIYSFHILKLGCMHSKLLTRLKIQKTPAIISYRYHKYEQILQGETKRIKIEEFINNLHTPLIKFIDETRKIDDFKKHNPVIAHFSLKKDNINVLRKIAKIARIESPKRFLYVVRYGLETESFVLHRSSDNKEIKFEGEIKKKNILKFLYDHEIPFLQQMDKEVFQQYLDLDKRIGFLILDHDLPEKTDLHPNVPVLNDPNYQLFNSFYDQMYQKVSFLWRRRLASKQICHRYGIQKFPGILITDPYNENYYRYDGEFTKQEIFDWLEKYKNGKLKPSQVSEPIPKTNDKLIKKIVKNNWDEIVLDEEKHVLLLVVTDSCQDCKDAKKVLKKVAKNYLNNNNFIFGIIDGAKNELGKGVFIKNAPTFLLFPSKQKKKYIEYTEDPFAEELIELIEEHCMGDKEKAQEIKETGKSDENGNENNIENEKEKIKEKENDKKKEKEIDDKNKIIQEQEEQEEEPKIKEL